MASVAVFVCPTADQQVVAGVPSCTNNAGAWQQVELQEAFDPSTLNSDELAGAFGAGWVVYGSIMAAMWGAKAVFRAIGGHGNG